MKLSLNKWLLCSLFVAILALAGCQQQPQEVSHAAELKKRTLLLDWLPNPNHVPLYAGIEKGFFAKRGMDIEALRLHDTADSLPMVALKQVDVAINCTPYVLSAIGRGAPIKILAVWLETSFNGFFYRADSGIQSLKDLDGREIGSASLGPVNQEILKTASEQGGITFQNTRRVTFDGVVNLATGAVDAVFGTCCNIEPEQLRALGVDPGYFLLPPDVLPDIGELIFIANAELLQENPDFAQNFREAVQESLDFARAHPEEAFALYLKANPYKEEETIAWEARSWQITCSSLAKSQVIIYNQWAAFYAWMEERGLIANPFPVEQAFESGCQFQ